MILQVKLAPLKNISPQECKLNITINTNLGKKNQNVY